MRPIGVLGFALVLALVLGVPARHARAKEEPESKTARQDVQALWYGGNPKLVLEGLTNEAFPSIVKDAESLVRLMMYANDALPRGDFAKKQTGAWSAVVKHLEALVTELEDRHGARYAWAREETKLLVARLKNRLGTIEDPWKDTSDAIREISKTEGSGLWTQHGYMRAFLLHAQELEAPNGNFFSSAGAFVYLRAKMKFIQGRLSDFALKVGSAQQPYVEAFMAVRGDEPSVAKGRPKLESALGSVAGYLGDEKAPAAAIRLHNDLAELVERVPDLEMEVPYAARELGNFRSSLLPRLPAVEDTLTVAVPYSRLMRILEGRLGDAQALHLLRTRPDGTLLYEITVAALDPKAKCVVPGSKSKVKGSAHKSIAKALAKEAKRRVGAGAKATGPTKGEFSKGLRGAWLYTIVGKNRSVRGAVGKGSEHTYVVEITSHAAADAKLPGDVQLVLDGLAIKE